jgi:hypothetical protein
MSAAAVLGASSLTAMSGCTTAQLDGGKSPAYLIVTSIAASSGAEPERTSSVLSSDVQTLVSTTINGQQVKVPTVYEDTGQVSLRLAMKDPGSIDSPSSPSVANFITVNRYHVKFIRADGRNVQGVDVPYEFDGAVTATVGTGVTTVGFSLVRIQAKFEAPLRALVGGGGAVALSTIAEVTFYGVDQAGREVTVTGSIGVTFADWGDPD